MKHIIIFAILVIRCCDLLPAQTEKIHELEKALAQSNDSTKVMIMKNLCWEYLRVNIDSSINYGQRAVFLAKEIKSAGLGAALNNLGISFIVKGDYNQAITTLKEALKIQEKANNHIEIARCLANLGIVYKKVGDYTKALEYQQRSYNIKLNLGDSAGMGKELISLGILNFKQSRIDKASGYYEEALTLFRKINHLPGEAMVLHEIGRLQKANGDYKKAISTFQNAIEIREGLDDKRGVANVLNTLASTYLDTDDFESAIAKYTQALALSNTINRPAINTQLNLANCYLQLNQTDKALSFIPDTRLPAYSKDNLFFAYEILANIYEKKGNAAKALKYHKLYVATKDGVFNQEKSEQIARMEAQFDLEKKEQQINAQEEQLSILQQKNIADRNLRFALIVSAVLLLLLALFIYNRYRLKMKSEKALKDKNLEIEDKNHQIEIANKELEKRMLRAQMDPHFIFNSLNSIQHFIAVNDKASALKYLSKFSKLIRQMLENSVNINVPIADEVKLLEVYLELESLRFSHNFSYDIQIDDALDIYNTEIPFLLIQPYAENAIKHGLIQKNGEGKLDIEIKEEKGYISCTIKDNGIGRKAAGIIKSQSKITHQSRAMSVTQQRLQLLNKKQGKKTSVDIADLYDDHNQAKGTKVEIHIPA